MTKARMMLVKNMAFLDALAGELYEKGTLLNSDVSRIREQCATGCHSGEAVS